VPLGRVLLVVLLIAAILVVVFASGWADDQAKPGSRGRAVVSSTAR
jgi:hypothetical protein